MRQAQITALSLGALQASDQRTNSSAIQKGHCAQVDHQPGIASIDCLADPILEFDPGVRIDAPDWLHNSDTVWPQGYCYLQCTPLEPPKGLKQMQPAHGARLYHVRRYSGMPR